MLALGGECRDQPGLRDIKQRAQDAAEVELANGRHSGQAVGPAARGAAQQVGLDLVSAVMAGQEMQATRLAAPLPEETVAGRPRHVLNVGARLFAFPDEDFVGDRAPSKPARQPAELGRAFRPQAMVDREGADLAAALPRPAVGEDRQREAVGAARDRDGDQRRGFERGETVESGGELGQIEGRRRVRGASATELLFLLRRPVLDGAPGMREITVELHQCNAGVVLLIGAGERHAEL